MTAHAIEQAIAPLAEVDARIASSPRGPLTLDPKRARSTPIQELVERLASASQLPHLSAAATAVAEAQLRCFPENLFWDFDFYLASIHRQAEGSPSYPDHLATITELTVELMGLYGQQSAIRFRYVHDFIYGFDWARWVRRDPENRSSVGPFSLEFLEESDRRGRDILELIEADDGVYPKLQDESARNPFPFPREPDQELSLYRALASRRGVPVEAWRVEAAPDAGRDFDAIREETAADLGLRR